MSNLQLKVQIAAIDKITAPLRGIAKQSQRLSQGYRADMGQYNSVLKSTKGALKDVQAEQQRLAKIGAPVSNELIQSEKELLSRINETNKAIDMRNAKMDKEMGLVRRRQAAMDRGKEQMSRGVKMTGAATAATYVGARFMMPGFNFDEQMSKVQALTRMNADDPMLAKLREQAKELGATTWASATQAADAQGFYAMAGFDPQAIMDALPSTLDLAKAGGVDVGRAADIGSNILSAFGLDPSEMNKVSDILVSVFTRTNTSIETLGETMKYVAPIANKLNIPLEETAAMAGILGNIGIQGSQAGTSLKTLAVNLAAPTGRAAKALDTLKIKTKDAAGNFRGMPDIIIDMIKATEKMGDAQRLGYLTDIAGKEAAAGFAGFIDENGYDEFIKIIEAAYNAEGEAARVAGVMSDNVKGDWVGFLSAIEAVQINVSELETGGIRSLIQSITEMTRKISDWIKENPKLAGTLFRVTAGIVAVVGGLGALSIAMAIFNMAVLANPIVLVIAAIIAAIVALVYYKDQIWEFFQAFFDAPVTYIQKGLESLVTLRKRISEFLSKIPIIGGVLSFIYELSTAPFLLLKWVIDKVIEGISWISNAWIMPAFDMSGANKFTGLLRGSVDFILNLRKNISDILKRIPVIGSALSFIYELSTAPFLLLSWLIEKAIQGVEWLGNMWVSPTIDTSGFTNFFNTSRGILDFLLDFRNSVSDLIYEIPYIGPLLSFIYDVATLPFAWLMQAIKEVIKGFEWIGDNWSTIAGWFGSMWDFILSATQPVVDMFEWVLDLIQQMITGISELFSFEAPDWMKKTGNVAGNTYDYFANSLSYTGDLIGEQLDGVFGRTPKQRTNAGTAALVITPANPIKNITTTNHQEVHVEVHATTNASPDVIGGAVARAIKSKAFIGDEH
ncbi:phage tail tape measure protein [Ignatzschineria rhizosphaerae]|uniref:Phage tail tape measure protein n=1 Tax=Ignatzschineria rhizosphaerae TaxID=2923279 RepID=A0ABY3X188_9GAMM|nr:phage tail tape measure protein [Ignatzschineria rhizosphaerae]UNM96065.1 phage tail tape measure protein [Ignatzschineria rhizosphaerae]